MSNRNRTAGHNWEREVRNDLIELGWEDAATSRYASREMDDLKVDLVRTDPYYIQCKTSAKKIDYLSLLNEMPDTNDIASSHLGATKVVVDKITKKVGKRFVTQGKLAVMDYHHFLVLIERLKKYESTN